MNKDYYEMTKRILVEANLLIVNSEYHNKAFGSWYIEVNAIPKHRICWDGKEFRLFIEEITNEVFNGLPVWKEKWAIDKPSRNDWLIGVNFLKNL